MVVGEHDKCRSFKVNKKDLNVFNFVRESGECEFVLTKTGSQGNKMYLKYFPGRLF